MYQHQTRSLDPPIVAAAAFVALQISIGFCFTIAQSREEKYVFSQSSCLAITEFAKFCLSASLFHRHHSLQNDQGRSIPKLCKEGMDLVDDDCEAQADAEPFKSQAALEWRVSKGRASSSAFTEPSRQYHAASFQIRISFRRALGMIYLACLYAAMNNTLFLLHALADLDTISLIRSSMTLLAAVTLFLGNGGRVTGEVCMGTLIQICGIWLSSSQAGSGSSLPQSVYLLVALHCIISIGCGIFSQRLFGQASQSDHVDKLVLYGAGTFINVAVHMAERLATPKEHGFFHGLNSWSAFLVIVSNVIMGLAVLKAPRYASTVIQSYKAAVAASASLFVVGLVCRLPISVGVQPGTLAVFTGCWASVDGVLRAVKDGPAESTQSVKLSSGLRRIWRRSPLQHGPYRIGISLASTFTIGLIICLDRTYAEST